MVRVSTTPILELAFIEEQVPVTPFILGILSYTLPSPASKEISQRSTPAGAGSV